MAARFQWDDFVLDLDSYRLERAGHPLALEPKAFNLLLLMVQRPGHLFTKQEIFEALWPDTAVTDHALTRVVAQLRRVLGDEAREARYIETVPTRGYRWIYPLTEPAPKLPETPVTQPGTQAPHAPKALGLFAALSLGAVALMFLGWAQRNAPASALATESIVATPDPHWPVQLTTYGGLDFHPALSPQGDAIAFASDRSGAFEIYVRGRGNGAVEVPLTANRGQNVQPAWSPDGQFLAFHSMRDGGIWVMAARGGTAQQVSPFGSRPSWSPDGRRLAFQSSANGDVSPVGFSAQAGSTIWIIDRDGTNARALTSASKPRGGHASPDWNRDGRFIVFSVFEGGGDNGIWIAPTDGGDPWPLSRGPYQYDPVFANDDSAVYVAGGEAWVVVLPFSAHTGKANGTHRVVAIPGVQGVRGLTVSADGRRLGFAGVSLDSQIWSLPLSADGTPGRPAAVTSDTSHRNSGPMFSPDGRRIAYMSIRRGELPNVWVMDADGGNASQITADETAEFRPTWSKDGTRITYLSRKGSAGGLWMVDVATRRAEFMLDLSQPKGLGEIEGALAEIDVAPSGSQIAFTLLTAPVGQRALFVSPIALFQPKPIGAADISAGYPVWSPDERSIAVEIFERDSTHAGVIDLASGTLRRLTSDRGHTWVRSWSPDGRRIAAALQRGGQWHLGWIDAETGRQDRFSESEPPRVFVRYPHWSPSGDRIVFERGETRGNLWTIAAP